MHRPFSTDWANSQTLKSSVIAKVQRACGSALFHMKMNILVEVDCLGESVPMRRLFSVKLCGLLRSANSNGWLTCAFAPVLSLFCRPGFNWCTAIRRKTLGLLRQFVEWDT